MTQPHSTGYSISPEHWFTDCTYLGHDRKWKEIIEQRCPLGSGFVPLIDYDEELGWVFHTLLTPDGLKSQKQIASRFRRAPHRLESRIEEALFLQLSRLGKRPRRQVACSAGIADIVTAEAVYEIKVWLNADVLFQAVGQALLYRESINRRLRAIVVGRVRSNLGGLYQAAEAIGVEVLPWMGKDLPEDHPKGGHPELRQPGKFSQRSEAR